MSDATRTEAECVICRTKVTISGFRGGYPRQYYVSSDHGPITEDAWVCSTTCDSEYIKRETARVTHLRRARSGRIGLAPAVGMPVEAGGVPEVPSSGDGG